MSVWRIIQSHCILIVVFLCCIATSVQGREKEAFSVAKRAFSDGLYNVAARQCEKIYPQLPEEMQQECLLLLGRCYFELGNYSNSVSYFQQIRIEDADKTTIQFAEAQYWTGRIHEQTGNIPKALFAYEAAIGSGGTNAYTGMAASSLARLFLQRGETKRAKAAASNVILQVEAGVSEVGGEGPFWLAQAIYAEKNYAHAIRYIEGYIQAGKTNTLTPYMLCTYAGALFHSGITNRAADICAELFSAADNPRDVRSIALYYSGSIALANGVTNQAIEYFSHVVSNAVPSETHTRIRMVETKKGFPYVHAIFELGKIAFVRGDMKKAADAYTRIIEQYPDSEHAPYARLGRGLGLFKTGDVNGATQEYARIIHAPDSPVREFALIAWADIEKEKNRYSRAIQLYTELAETTTGRLQKSIAHFSRGVCLYTIGHYDDAAVAFATAQEYPAPEKNENALIWRAWSLLRAEKIEDAKNAFETYVQYHRNGKWYWAAQLQRAIIASRQEQYEDSRQLLQMIETNTESRIHAARAACELGWVYRREGKIDNAIAQFTGFITQYPESVLADDIEFHLGEFYFNMGDYTRAYSTFRNAAEKRPHGKRAGESIYWASLSAYRQKNTTNALHFLTSRWETVAASTRAADAWLLRGDCERQILQLTNALHIYEQLISHFSNSYRAVDARFNSAGVYEELGDVKSAEDIYRELINDSRAVNRARAHVRLGDVLSHQGKLRDAIGEWLHVIYDYREYTTFFNDAVDRAGKAYEYLDEPARAQLVYQLRGTVEPHGTPASAVP